MTFRYESDRIQENSKNNGDKSDNIIMLPYCSIQIQNIEPKDNGNWTCSIMGINDIDKEITQIQGFFNLVVEKGLNFTFFGVNFAYYIYLFFQYICIFKTFLNRQPQFRLVNSLEHLKRNRNKISSYQFR